MARLFKLFFTVLVFSAVAGGLLSMLEAVTKERIETQQLLFLKGPAVKEIMEGCSNDPLTDRIRIKEGKEERQFFVGKFDGKPNVVAFESYGKGFGGKIGVMVGVDIDKDKIVGIAITTHSETPGLGARAKTEKSFKGQFKGKDINKAFKVKADGGDVDAVSGATITSRGVCMALEEAKATYMKLKPEILKNLGKM